MAEFPMHLAAKEGDLERVKHLIEGGVSVDSRDDEGRTPLHWAAERGRLEVAELLIRSKCDLNPKDSRGRTPVMLAAMYRNKDAVDLLLQRGAQVNCADNLNYTLLLSASENGWADVVQRIMESGGTDVDAANKYGDTPLMRAAYHGHKDVAALLIRAGADINQSNALKTTALHWASERRQTEVVQVLLEEEGLDLNPRDDSGLTPLHFACWWGPPEVVKLLLAAGADPNIKDEEGDTVLGCGISKLTAEEIRLFVHHGAFLEDCYCWRLTENPDLKENILQDVDLCTRSIVNKFHRQSLPALYSNPHFARSLPPIENWKLGAQQTREIANFVESEIEAKTFCNVVEARPTLLSLMCVRTLLDQDSTRNNRKRSAAQAFSSGNSAK